MARGQYIYAILRPGTAIPAGLLGLNEAPLEAILCRDLAAVTSAIDFGELCPCVDHVLRHEAVVEAVRDVGPALPVRFGTVLAGPEAVERELDERYGSLTSDLARLGNNAEFGLAVLWQPADLEDSGAWSTAPDALGSGARYLQTRRAEYRRESMQRERARALADVLNATLKPHALDHRAIILPTARLALRATYLVKPEREERFRMAFEDVRGLHPELRLLLSGPWPPYSFVTAPTVETGSAAGRRACPR